MDILTRWVFGPDGHIYSVDILTLLEFLPRWTFVIGVHFETIGHSFSMYILKHASRDLLDILT